ncbi:MAG: branched-chain amino acid aminotransferase [Rhodospirillales bacterium]|nr:branched-chain amino acid aminotransferase [Alphaproteobacteria bacterium]MCB9986143.1 branched-chain amino acid aminotransferase [Rhodospirillales bacterium]USO07298.1 MAG: branched-chain amino acid aminotransferase [Rhodospirillales bacterium]
MTVIPFDQRDGFIWVDGQMVPWKEAKIHFLTHALHYGSCVFEGIRAYNGKPFKLTEHNQRLHRSAQILDMDIPFDVATLDRACRDVLASNGMTDAYLRPAAWRGAEMMGIAGTGTRVHVAIACWKWGKYYSPELLEKGVSLHQSKWAKPAHNTAPTESKAAGLYMIGTLARHEAEAAGFNDALMLDWRGLVAESSGANLFIVKDGVLKTPVPDCFLNGITRQTVMQIARDAGIRVEETRITLDDLWAADEVFLTGTAAEITPVGRIDSHQFTVGPVTRQLHKSYEEAVYA